MAFFAADVFLRLNGWKLQVNAKAAYAFLGKRFETDTCNLEQLRPWIRRNLVRL